MVATGWVVSYIKIFKKHSIEKLDYLIVTHPHNDHIGGLPRIIKYSHKKYNNKQWESIWNKKKL